MTGKSLQTSAVVAYDSVGRGVFINLIKCYFAFKTRLKISDQKFLNFAECIAGKGKFCGRVAAASYAKNYGDSDSMSPDRSSPLSFGRKRTPLKSSDSEVKYPKVKGYVYVSLFVLQSTMLPADYLA